MLYILSGEDIVSSRNHLNQLIVGSSNVIRIEGKKATLADLDTSLISNSLFEDKKVVVVERFTKLKPEAPVIEILKRAQNDNSLDIILWDEAAPSVKIRSLKLAKSFSYDFPKVYFSFMDGLMPSNSRRSIENLTEVLKSYQPEQVLYSIIKRIRQLLILKSNNYQEFSEFARMQEWQIGRLKVQASKWTGEQLKSAFSKYLELDEKIKTGKLTMDLSKHLDIVLASDLN